MQEQLSDEAWSGLVREATILDAAPGLPRHSKKNFLDLALAEPTPSPLDRVRAFQRLVDAGITPPPHLLSFVAGAFRAYLRSFDQFADGTPDSDLNYAFGLKRMQKGGHPIKKARAEAARGEVLVRMFELLERAEAESPLEAARLAVTPEAKAEPSTLEGRYRTHRVDQFMRDAAALIAAHLAGRPDLLAQIETSMSELEK